LDKKENRSLVDFEWYRSFITIYKYRSVSEAAKARIMTQPAMSQHLAALETEVGEKLFTRTARKLIPTEKGKELYSKLAPLIEALEEKTLDLKASSTPLLPTIRLGSTLEFFKEWIVPNFEAFESRIVAYYGTAEELLTLLQDDKADIIITPKRFQSAGIDYVSLYEEEFVLVGRKDYPAPTFDTLSDIENWLVAQPWLSYGLELPIIRRFWREYFKKRPQINPQFVFPNLHLILEAIQKGAGISLLPTYMLTKNDEIKRLFDDMSVTNQIYLAYKSKHKQSPEIQHTIQQIQQLIQNRV